MTAASTWRAWRLSRSAVDPAALLERRYRRWLRAYPNRYRLTRGEELIGTLLDLADPRRSRPAPAELFALLRSGVAERIRVRADRFRSVWSRDRRGRSVARLSLTWTAMMGISLFLAPATLGYSCASDEFAGGPMVIDCQPAFGLLLAHHGLWGYLWLLPPLALTTVPILIPRPRFAVLAAAALTGYLVLTANSLGTFYLPALVSAWLAAAWSPPALLANRA